MRHVDDVIYLLFFFKNTKMACLVDRVQETDAIDGVSGYFKTELEERAIYG